MIAPIGFIPVSELLRGRVPNSVLESWHRSTWDGLFADRDDLLELLRTVTPGGLIEHAMWKVTENEVFLGSPAGEAVKFDTASFWASMLASDWSALSIYDLERAKASDTTLPLPPEIYFRYAMPPGHILDIAVNNASGAESRLSDEIWASGYPVSFPLVPIFYERVGYSVDLGAYDIAVSLGAITEAEHRATSPGSGREHWRMGWLQHSHTMERLRRYEGWSLCVPEAFLSTDWQLKIAEFLDRLIESANPSETVKHLGRPSSKKDATAAAYLKLYPNGHGQEQWLKVLKKVNELSGLDASADTLKRAVQQAQNPRYFDAEGSAE